MKVIKYKILVTTGDLGFVHGFKHYIHEVYFADYGLFVNPEAAFIEKDVSEAAKRLAQASQDEEKELDIDYEFVATFCELLEQEKRLKEKIFEKRSELQGTLFPVQ